jgi:hypothetical protein
MNSHIQPMVGKRCTIRGHHDTDLNGLHGTVAQLFFSRGKTPVYAVALDRDSPKKHTFVPGPCVHEAADYNDRACRQCGAVAAELVICLTCMLPDDDDRPRSWMAYCSEACRQKHRPQHKEECNGILAYAWFLCALPGDQMRADTLEHAQGWPECDWPPAVFTGSKPERSLWHCAVGRNQRGGERCSFPDSKETFDVPLQNPSRQTWWQLRDAGNGV